MDQIGLKVSNKKWIKYFTIGLPIECLQLVACCFLLHNYLLFQISWLITTLYLDIGIITILNVLYKKKLYAYFAIIVIDFLAGYFICNDIISFILIVIMGIVLMEIVDKYYAYKDIDDEF